MMMKLKLNDRAAQAIKNNTKKVEIRANKKGSKHDYSKLKENDIIEFESNNLGIFYVKVKEVNHYDTLEDLLTLEGTRYTTSSTNDFNEAIKNVNRLDGYTEAIKKSGVYAIHIEYLYSQNTVWDELYEKAKSVINKRNISGLVSVGSVGAAILTKNHTIYTGICIDTACSLGMCAERNAMANMLTNGDDEIDKLVCIDSNGHIDYPCGSCRENMMQLSKNSKNIEILMNYKTKEIVKLNDLIPSWWGSKRI